MRHGKNGRTYQKRKRGAKQRRMGAESAMPLHAGLTVDGMERHAGNAAKKLSGGPERRGTVWE